MRDGEQPPLDEHQPPRQLLRVAYIDGRLVIGYGSERERWIAIGAEQAVGVESDTPAPAQHTEVEVEDRTRVAPREQNREEGNDRQQHEGDQQEEEHDEMRDAEQPLNKPEPAAELRIESSLDANRLGRNG